MKYGRPLWAFVGCIVVARGEMRSSVGVASAGTHFEVERVDRRGLVVGSEICPHCGLGLRFTGVDPRDVWILRESPDVEIVEGPRGGKTYRRPR